MSTYKHSEGEIDSLQTLLTGEFLDPDCEWSSMNLNDGKILVNSYIFQRLRAVLIKSVGRRKSSLTLKDKANIYNL